MWLCVFSSLNWRWTGSLGPPTICLSLLGGEGGCLWSCRLDLPAYLSSGGVACPGHHKHLIQPSLFLEERDHRSSDTCPERLCQRQPSWEVSVQTLYLHFFWARHPAPIPTVAPLGSLEAPNRSCCHFPPQTLKSQCLSAAFYIWADSWLFRLRVTTRHVYSDQCIPYFPVSLVFICFYYRMELSCSSASWHLLSIIVVNY